MGAEDVALPIHHVTGRLGARDSLDESRIVASGNEAELHALRLVAGGKVVARRQCAHLALAQRSYRESDLRQSLLAEREEKIALVLCEIGRTTKGEPLPLTLDSGVMASRQLRSPRAGTPET